MAVITISRQFGAGGLPLGKMIAEKLNYRFLDDFLIDEIAKEAKVPRKEVISMEKRLGIKASKVASILFSSSYIDRKFAENKAQIDEDAYFKIVRNMITKLAAEDNVVLIGRGSQYILAEKENAYHFLLVATKKDQIKIVRRIVKMTRADAEKIIKQGQRKRDHLYKKLRKTDFDEPNPYHMVLNMSRLSFERARDQVCSVIEG